MRTEEVPWIPERSLRLQLDANVLEFRCAGIIPRKAAFLNVEERWWLRNPGVTA